MNQSEYSILAVALETALLSAVPVLWAALVAVILYVKRSAEQCEKDRRALWKAILELQPRTCSRDCPNRERITLSEDLVTLAKKRAKQI